MNIPLWKAPPRPKGKWERRARWAIGLFLAYTIFGFLILPLIVKAVAVRKLSSELHREVSIDKLRMNPFVLSASIKGLLIKDPDGQPLVSWDEVFANFQLASFFGKPWVFKEVRTVNPSVRVQMNKDYSLNFSDLIEESKKKSSGAPSKPLALRIDRLQISGAKASYTDLTPRNPFSRVLGPLDLILTDFRTDPNNKNPYSFAGTTDAGEKFSWSGHFFLSPLRSAGELTLESITLNKYAPLYEDFVRFVVKDGTIDLRSTYDFELSASNRVASVTNASMTLHSLKLAESKEATTNLVEVPEFSVNGVSADAFARHGEINSVIGRDARLWFRRNADSAINVVEMSKPSEHVTNAPGGILLLLRSVTNVVAMLLDSTNKWTGVVHDVSLTGGSVMFEDLVKTRPVRLELTEMDLELKELSNQAGTNFSAALSLRWNTNGTIKGNLTGSTQPVSADVDLAVDQLELKPLDPYLESKVNLFILGSKFGLNGKIQLRTPENGLPDVSFKGDAWLEDFATVDSAFSEPLLKWDIVRVSGMEAKLNPPTVDIKEVGIKDASAHLVIETNRTINLLMVMRIGDSNTVPEFTLNKAKRAEQKQKAKVIAESPRATNVPLASTLPKFSVGRVVLTNSQLELLDRSLSPNVNLGVRQLEGTIAGIASDEQKQADINLRAKVDDVGPVEISGNIKPLSKDLEADFKILVKDVDLTPTSPYSGKFAGYRIAKGKLNMELSYRISERKLTAKNLIILDQFSFGEKVESPDATKLPVKLAVAVLKDRNGKIELDVPVDGSLDDPQFHLGKVINRAIVNVITKIVTSPFAVLGAVFGGKGEELNFVDFTPGSSALSQEGKSKLDSIAKGLYERPALQLDIEGSVQADADREGLRGIALGKQLRQKKWMSLSKSARAETPPEKLTLKADEAAKWIQTLYRLGVEKGEVKPAQPGASAGDGTTNEIAKMSMAAAPRPASTEIAKGATALLPPEKVKGQGPSGTQKSSGRSGESSAPLSTADMARSLMNAIPVSDVDLQTLATERAKSVREYLLQAGTEKVDPSRVFLMENKTPGINDKGHRVLLQLK